jgi:hypothetical protein
MANKEGPKKAKKKHILVVNHGDTWEQRELYLAFKTTNYFQGLFHHYE